jgi:hypothetical protein
MKLSRESMNAITDLAKVSNWDAVAQDKKDLVIARCQEMLPKVYSLTEIEGVRNLSGAQAVLEKACMTVLNKLGAKPSDATLDQLILDRALGLEFAAAAPAVKKPVIEERDLDF